MPGQEVTSPPLFPDTREARWRASTSCWRALPELASEHGVRLVPGVNEELAATSVWGSQLELPRGVQSFDGVIGVWYGKGPGLDRASDALRHAAMYGAHPAGGALVLVGDDPAAKSSSVPAASERSLAALSMPIFFPRNAEEIVAFGLYGIALSRASGCWSAMKIVADVADGIWTLDRGFHRLRHQGASHRVGGPPLVVPAADRRCTTGQPSRRGRLVWAEVGDGGGVQRR